MRRPHADLEEKQEPSGTMSACPEPSMGEMLNETKMSLTNAAIEKRTFAMVRKLRIMTNRRFDSHKFRSEGTRARGVTLFGCGAAGDG
jgi:hypothetical protein